MRDMLFVEVVNLGTVPTTVGIVPFNFKDSDCDSLTAFSSLGPATAKLVGENGVFTSFVNCHDAVLSPGERAFIGSSVSRARLSVADGEDQSFGDALGATPAARFDHVIILEDRRPWHFMMLPKQGGRCGLRSCRWRGQPSSSEQTQMKAFVRRLPSDDFAAAAVDAATEQEWVIARLAASVLATGASATRVEHELLKESGSFPAAMQRLSAMSLCDVAKTLSDAPDGLVPAETVSPPTSTVIKERNLIKNVNQNQVKGDGNTTTLSVGSRRPRPHPVASIPANA
ncbi:MAG TPA: hypothetical protein PKA64_15965, partial [Myxococcota bacterium]|nr:hypothetical protein [Myxococcota bacterium]